MLLCKTQHKHIDIVKTLLIKAICLILSESLYKFNYLS